MSTAGYATEQLTIRRGHATDESAEEKRLGVGVLKFIQRCNVPHKEAEMMLPLKSFPSPEDGRKQNTKHNVYVKNIKIGGAAGDMIIMIHTATAPRKQRQNTPSTARILAISI